MTKVQGSINSWWHNSDFLSMKGPFFHRLIIPQDRVFSPFSFKFPLVPPSGLCLSRPVSPLSMVWSAIRYNKKKKKKKGNKGAVPQFYDL